MYNSTICVNNTFVLWEQYHVKKQRKSDSSAVTKGVESDTVEVLYMHGKQRCITCVAIGTETESLIKELANDKVVVRTVDFSTPEGEKIADKYEIASSSIIVVKDGKVYNRIKVFQKWFSLIVALLFIAVGIYYGIMFYL